MNKVLTVALLVAAGVAYWKLRGMFKAGAFDPTSNKNLAYQGANKVLAAATGDQVNSLGTKFYEFIHGSDYPL